MAETIDRLYRLTVDGAQAARDLNAIAKSTADLDKRMADSINSITRFGKALAGAVSVGAIVHGFQSIIESFDQIGKDAQKIGVGVEELQRLRYAADLSGVGAEKMNAAVTKLAVSMGELGNATSKAGAVLRSAGVTSADNAEEALAKLADRFAAMPDGVQKTAEAVAVFGKAVGPDLIPLLNGGAEGIKKLTDETEKFGGVVSGKSIKAAEEFNDNLSRMQRTVAGVGVQLAEAMLPALVAISGALTEAAKEGDGFTKSGQVMGDSMIRLARMAIVLGERFSELAITIGAAAAAALHPFDSVTINREWLADLQQMRDEAQNTIDSLEKGFERAKLAFPENPKPSFGQAAPAGDPAEAARRAAEGAAAAAQRQKEAQKELDEQERRRMVTAKLLIDIENDQARVTDDLTKQQERNAKATKDAADATAALIRVLDPAGAAAEDFSTKINQIDDLFFSGAVGVEQYEAMLKQLYIQFGKIGPQAKKQREAIDVLGDSFNQFLSDAANSAGHLEEAFKRMVQSIVAGLLQLLAKKYILDVFAGFLGLPVKAATGMAFDSQGVIPFARGGVISRPVVFPMAMAGEAGPEAILPLQRAANGNLGVQAQTQPLNVTVNNYADATVTTRRTGPNDLEVIVERARQAIAADLRSGGNLVSRSLEQAYGVGRGAAAAF